MRSGSLYQNLTLLYNALILLTVLKSVLKNNTVERIEMFSLVYNHFYYWPQGTGYYETIPSFSILWFSIIEISLFLSHFDLKQICCTLPCPRQLVYNAVCTLWQWCMSLRCLRHMFVHTATCVSLVYKTHSHIRPMEFNTLLLRCRW